MTLKLQVGKIYGVKLFKRIFLAVVILLLLVFWIVVFSFLKNCDTSEPEPRLYYFGYREKFWYNAENDFDFSYNMQSFPFGDAVKEQGSEADLAEIVGSSSDLKALSYREGYPFFDEEDSLYQSELGEKIRSYNDSYFEEHSLLLLFMFDKPYSYMNIKDIEVENENVVITLLRPDDMFNSEYRQTYLYLIELTKQYLSGSETPILNYVTNGRIYALKESFEQGELGMEDLKNIAYYANECDSRGDVSNISEDFVPSLTDPDASGDYYESIAIEAFYDYIFSPLGDRMPIDRENTESLKNISLYVCGNLGKYNGYFALFVKSRKYEINFDYMLKFDDLKFYLDTDELIVLWQPDPNYPFARAT